MLERYFKLAENQTTIRQEMLGGLTTFMTMAYVIVVNPQILAQAGMPPEGVLFATCIASAAATLVMGLYANYPIALAPGMSLNAYFTYSVCLGMHIPWQTALGVVFFSGVLFVLLTVSRVREQIVNGIPDSLKHSTAAGIGMFIAFVGLKNAKLVVANPATLVSIGSFSDREVQAACFGLVLMLILIVRKVKGAMLIGILGTTLLGILRGMSRWPTALVSIPHPSLTFLKFDLHGALHLGLFEIMFIFLFVDLLDNVGTLVAVCEQAGFVKDGKIPRVGRALLADAVGTLFGSMTGTSTVTSYIESAAGVSAGARTGLSNILVAALFLGAVFFSPGCDRDSCFRHSSGADSSRRADDSVGGARQLGRFQRRFSGVRHRAGNAAHLQHRHRPEPRCDFLHSGENRRGKISRDQLAALDPHRAFHPALHLPRSSLD